MHHHEYLGQGDCRSAPEPVPELTELLSDMDTPTPSCRLVRSPAPHLLSAVSQCDALMSCSTRACTVACTVAAILCAHARSFSEQERELGALQLSKVALIEWSDHSQPQRNVWIHGLHLMAHPAEYEAVEGHFALSWRSGRGANLWMTNMLLQWPENVFWTTDNVYMESAHAALLLLH